MELAAIVCFLLALGVCVFTGASILYALIAGYLIFFGYGLLRKFTAAALLKMSWDGVATVKNILIVFILIGMITAVWRAAGTIPLIIYTAGGLIQPGAFLVITFLLNCLLSLLTGTSFGTAATIGVITMSIGNVMGISPVYLGGAILGGAFFGDRCSPMSTSALLTCTLTGTDIFTNIKLMLKNAAVPFAATCVIYGVLGSYGAAGAVDLQILNLFKDNFNLHLLTFLPALLIIVLSIFKVSVKKTMLASIVTACVLCLILQGVSAGELLQILWQGYRAPGPELAKMLNGGGIVSMFRAVAIVGLSSSYSGIFAGTGLLDGVKNKIAGLAASCTPFGSTLLISFLTGMVACNQTLAIMLTHQLCADTISEKQELALTLEDTTVLTAALIPWSIASAVPLTAVGAPALGIAAACYLYLQPLWSLGKHLWREKT